MIDFPEEAFDYLEQNNIVERFITFIIDRRYRKAVYLKNWISPQVERAKEDERILEIVKKIPNYQSSYDAKALWLLRYVAKNFKYVSDSAVWNTLDYWQTYEESLDKMTGDCEDGAILLYVLCRVAGIPANRLLILCGDVSAGRGKTEGHAWLAYRPQKNPINMVFLDWCYWFSPEDIYKRTSYFVAKDNIIQSKDTNYVKMWWCFNEVNTYAQFKPTWSKNSNI